MTRGYRKAEFPRLHAWVSTTVATPLIIIVTLLYMERLNTKLTSDISGICLSAIGITIALAALCSNFARNVAEGTSSSDFTYAAEKFFHSSLLLIQTLFIVFARDSLVDIEWIAHYGLLKSSIIHGVCNAVASFVSAMAAWSWYCGFSALNSALWSRWQRRIEVINRARRQPCVFRESTPLARTAMTDPAAAESPSDHKGSSAPSC
jgi:hypothetical protein